MSASRAPCTLAFLAALSIFLFAPPIPTGGAIGPETLSVDGDTTLTEDHEGPVIFVVDSAILDCAGHTINGTGMTVRSAGIIVHTRADVTVRNCVVVGFATGIRVTHSTGVRLEGNTASENLEIGVEFSNTSDSEVVGNVARLNDGKGFELHGERLVVEGNSAVGNYDSGFKLVGPQHIVEGNVSTGNATGFATINGTNLTIISNVATGNTWVGFDIDATSGSSFTFNDGSRNGTGFAESAGLGNVYTSNTAHQNTHWGFYRFDPDEIGPAFYASNRCVGNGDGGSAVAIGGREPVPAYLCAASGFFRDDDGSVFEADIEWMAAEGITKGCNPPANDHFCPDGVVTRGQMAAFLVRALELTDRLDDVFTDDDASIFEPDIERLAAAGITKGCNPATNDRFCPDERVTRGQMAAFLVRAFGYADDGGGDLFIDDDDSIFEADIDRLGTAGVTRGCDPPANTRFCPVGNVTRGQMAAFLHRALG